MIRIMKNVELLVLLMLFSFPRVFAQKIAVLDFKAGVGISQTDVDGLSSTFVTYFSPRGYQLVERAQINQVIEEQGFQQTSLTESQMVRLGQIMNLSKIVVGDVNIVGGSPNLDVRVIDVQSGEVTGRDGATFAWTNYRVTMQQLAQKVAGQIGVVYGGGSNGNVQSIGKTPSGKVETLLGYLQVYPEDLGSFTGRPNTVIAAINRQRLNDYGDWRLPTNEELSLMATAKVQLGMGSINGYMSQENANSGGMKIVRLVRSGDIGYGTLNGGLSNDNILTEENLKKAGFRFLKRWCSNNVNLRMEDGTVCTVSNAFLSQAASYTSMTECYGGTLSSEGKLNGLVIIKGKGDNINHSWLAYICNGKMAYPILSTSYSEYGLCIALDEGVASYGCLCPHWDGYSCFGLCDRIRDVYGKDFSDSRIISEIYYGTLEFQSWEKALERFVKNGKKLIGWSQYEENYYEF